MNSPVPDTRNSLIQRLSDEHDSMAWGQFVSIYEPLVYRLARRKGFQHADAKDVTQEVLLAVSRAVDRWKPDANRGRFRDWLFRIARNLMINFMTRRMHRPIGGNEANLDELLADHVSSDHAPGDTDASSVFDLEYRREVFHWAAEQVQRQVKPTTWQAFWKTGVERQSISDVAAEIKLTVGAVHIARSRVLARMRQLVQEFEQEQSHETRR